MNENVIGLAVSSAVGVLIVIISLVLLSGKGSFLVAGLNSMSDKERSKYNEKAICRFLGMIFMPIGIGIPLAEVGFSFGMKWLPGIWAVITIAVVVAAVMHINKNKKFKN